MSPAPARESPPADLTTLLHAWQSGSGTAFSGVIEQVYADLKQIAARRLRQSGAAATLSPTELLHEALIGIMPAEMDFKNRVHFFATMSLAIRSILVDRTRARMAEKRGGDQVRVTLTHAEAGEESMTIDLLAIDQALSELERMDPRCGQVMHLTYFGGLSRDEIAETLQVNVRTVARDLLFGRAWIAKGMSGDS